MSTVFSHIVQKRLSQEYENIATEALAYIFQCQPIATGAATIWSGFA